MAETFLVRRIAVGEWRALREIRLSALETEPTAFCATRAQEEPISDPIWEERCRMGAQSPRSALFVVCQGARFYGMILVNREEERAEIYQVFLDPSLRGRGLGRELLSHALQFAEGQPVWLEVNQELKAAEALYQRAGFQLDGSLQPRKDGRLMRGWVRA